MNRGRKYPNQARITTWPTNTWPTKIMVCAWWWSWITRTTDQIRSTSAKRWRILVLHFRVGPCACEFVARTSHYAWREDPSLGNAGVAREDPWYQFHFVSITVFCIVCAHPSIFVSTHQLIVTSHLFTQSKNCYTHWTTRQNTDEVDVGTTSNILRTKKILKWR